MKTFFIIFGCVLAIIAVVYVLSKAKRKQSDEEKEILELSKQFGGNIATARTMYKIMKNKPQKKSVYEEYHISPKTPDEIVKFIEKASHWDRYREDVGTIFYIRNKDGNGSHEEFENPKQDEEGRPFVIFSNGHTKLTVKDWGNGKYSTLKNYLFKDEPYLFINIDELNKAGFFQKAE